MTIYTHTNSEKKESDDLKSPMVVEDVPDLDLKKKTIDDDVILLPQPTAVIVARRQRVRTLYKLLLLFICVCVLFCGVLSGLYLYKHFMAKKLQRYSGWCGVQDLDEQRHMYQFQESVETDRETYEKIGVPAINDFREATILHDFDRNYTAIIDKLEDSCYVMPLNYSLVKPPKDFWDLISKIQTGYYIPDEQMIRENYEVLQPPVDDLSNFGYYVYLECRGLSTYRMARIDGRPRAMVKRSVCKQFKFHYNAGGRTVQLDLC